MNHIEKGKIYFVGAGPGDASLLTIKAAKILRKANVVISDRLVSEEILTDFVNPFAHIIAVGKQGGSYASKSQREINEILINAANSFSIVVRLKGGDVSLFSNILDELNFVKAAGIDYEIIPGISAISGATAYAGIPLTARGFASGVRILTYYDETAISESAWKDLARFEDTLVFYMSANLLQDIVFRLVAAGADATTPLVVIEQATTPSQRVYEFVIRDFIFEDYDSFVSPSIVIIGKVAMLYQKFAWLPNHAESISYFPDLKNIDSPIELLNSQQNEFHVSRA